MAKLSGDIDISKYVQQLAELKELVKKAKNGEEDLADVNKQLQDSFADVRDKVKELKDVYASLNKEMDNFNEKQSIANSLKTLEAELESVSKSLKNLREDVTSTNQRLNEFAAGGKGSGGGGSNAWGDFETQLKNINLTSEDLKKNFLDVKTTMDSSGTSVTTYNNNLDTTVKVYKRATEEGYQYKVTLEKINQENKNAVSNAQYIDTSTKALSRLGLQAEEVDDIIRTMNGESVSSWMVAKQSISANGDAVYELRNNLDKVVTVTQKNVNGTNQFSASLKNVANNAKEATKEAGTWGYSWKRAWQSFLTYMSVTDIFFRVKNAIVDMIHEVEELDEALVELKKVTDLEGDALERFIDNAYEAGRAVAKTGTEMVEAATSFAKSGYDSDMALKLGEVAAMYTNIADEEISTAKAADFIIAQLKAFNLEAENATKTLENAYHVIDAVNEVSNNFAVSSADIASNLGKASAVMANAGNSLEQMIGLMTAGTEITRNASKVANGLKTITLRLQGMNDEGEKDLQLQAQMEGLFKKLGISVYEANGELKNTYEIMGTLAEVYGDLTNAEKAYVTETIAGKFQAQNAAAILTNWTTAVEATETAMNSTGSAAEENAKVLDSIEGHLQQLASSWEELSHNLISSNLIKAVVDFGNALLKIANNSVVQGIAKLAVSLLAINTAIKVFNTAKTKIDLFTNGITKNTLALYSNVLAEAKLTKETQKSIIKILSQKGAVDKDTKSLSKETAEKIKATLASSGLTKAQQKAVLASMNQITANGLLSASTFSLKGAWDALTASIAANPIGAILVAVTITASIISSLVNSAQEKAEKQREALKTLNEETTAAYQDSKNAIDDEINRVKELRDELKDNNITQAEAIKVKDELLDIQKNLIDSYGLESDGLDLVNGKLDEQIDKIKQLKKIDAEKYLAENAANFKNTSRVTHTTNQFGANEIGITGANEDFIDSLFANKSGWGDAFSDDFANNKTYARWFYNQVLEKLKEYNEAYNEALNNGDKELASSIEKKRDELSSWAQKEDLKKQAEESEKTFDTIIDAYITSNDELSSAYEKMQDGIKSGKDINQAYMDAMLAIGKMKDENKLSDEWSYNLSKYFINLFWDYENTFNDEAKKAQDKALDQYQKSARGRTEAGNGSAIDVLFSDANEKTEQLKEFYNKLKEIADAEALTSDKAIEVINSFEEFSLVNGQLTDSLGRSVGSLQELLDYFNNVTDWYPNGQSILEGYSITLDGITSQYNKLTAAVDEYNSAGYLSLETFTKLINNDLLDYLSFENGQLIANTSELYNNAESARIAASQKLYNAMADDVLKVSEGDVEHASKLAQSAVAGLGNNAETAGNQAATATGKFIGFAEAVDQTNKALSGKEITGDIQKKITAVQNAYKPYFDLLSQPIKINQKKYTGTSSNNGRSSSSAAKQEKEWWEQALEALKNQFNYSDITIEQYINGLEGILAKLDKGSEAWKKINQELQKQRLDKVKDDYNAGRISLTQYIKELKNLQLAYKAGTDGWNKLADAIKKAELDQLKQQQNDLKAALAAVTNTIDKQIDKYKELKDAADDKYDDELDKLKELKDALNDDNDDYERAQQAVVKFLNEQLDAIDKERESIESYYDYVIDAIEDQNEAQEESLKLAEAYEAWMNAMTQKTKKVWREGLGWVWEADSKAIEEAKRNYDDLVHQANVKELEKQKDSTVKSLEEQIEALEAYINSWDEVFDKFDNEKNTNLANLLLGENWTEMVSNLDPQVVEDFSNAYYDLQKNIEETEKQIEDLNKLKEEEDEYWDKLINDLKEYKGQWSDIANIYEDAQDALKAKQLIGAEWERQILEQRLDVLENFKNKYNAILAEIDKVDNMSTNNASGYNPYSLPGYSNGGEVDFTGLAMLHGSKSRPEYVLNNDQMKNLLSNLTKPQYTSNFGAGGSQVINNYSFGNIDLPNVQNAQQFINELKSLINTSKNL